MGFFLKRFFSLRHKQKAAHQDSRPDTEISKPQPGNEEDGNATIWKRGFDEHAAFRSKRPKAGRKAVSAEARGDPDADADAAVSRLLRSSSTNYKVVGEAGCTNLSPLPHPINSVSSRSTSTLTGVPTRSQSIQGGGSYRVTVHKRQQLSATVFPNAYPPVTPRRPGIAHTSTPNLLATYSGTCDVATSASTSTSILFNPRKVPITPRDARRLSRLRQDPSVASLVKLYDDHGRIAESAFTTTPAPPQRLRKRRNRRKSTFGELLGCDGADLQWAESCIAQQSRTTSDCSFSNTSTTSFSSNDTPLLDSPATSTFNDADLDIEVPTPAPGLVRDPSASTVTGLEKEPGFSSLVVELSIATSDATDDSNNQTVSLLKPCGNAGRNDKGKENETPLEMHTRGERQSNVKVDESQDRTMGSQIRRKPSHRASQVFDFIAERRERRKSQELLQGSAIPVADAEKASKESGGSMVGSKLSLKSAGLSRTKVPSPLLNLAKSSTQGANYPKSAPPSRLGFDADPARAASLNPAPHPSSRSRSSTCSQATAAPMLRSASTASALPSPLSISGAATFPKGGTGTLTIMQMEQEWEKDRKKEVFARAQLREQQKLPVTSTPHPSKIGRFKKVSFASRHRSSGRQSERSPLGEVTNGLTDGVGADSERSSLERCYDAFAASLDVRTQQLQTEMQIEKRNARKPMTRRRGATIDLGSTHTATMTLAGTPGTKYAPQTPTRSQSLLRLEPGQGSSSELSPHTTQLMADLRVRRGLARTRAAAESRW